MTAPSRFEARRPARCSRPLRRNSTTEEERAPATSPTTSSSGPRSSQHFDAELAGVIAGGAGAIAGGRRRLAAAAAAGGGLLRAGGVLRGGDRGALVGALHPVDLLGEILRRAVAPPGEAFANDPRLVDDEHRRKAGHAPVRPRAAALIDQHARAGRRWMASEEVLHQQRILVDVDDDEAE